MTFDEFRSLDAKYREQDPSLFSLPSDALASSEMIETVEQALALRLPDKYVNFLTAFGGGNFGLVVIFSVDPNSEWNLVTQQAQAHGLVPSSFLAISDDFAGGYYGMTIDNGIVDERISYWDQETHDMQETEFSDVLEFITRYAYEPA